MAFCYVGKATKIFFFVVALITLAGLIVGFGFLRHGGARKAHGDGRPASAFPDPMPGEANAPASAARPEPLSPPAAVAAANPIAAPTPPVAVPAIGSPPPLPSPVVVINLAPPPAFLGPPAPASNALSPQTP